MTETQFRKKVKQLKREVNRLIDDRTKKILNTGAIDLNEWGDDFRLPKIFMSAVGREIYNEYMPFGTVDRIEVDNIYKFL